MKKIISIFIIFCIYVLTCKAQEVIPAGIEIKMSLDQTLHDSKEYKGNRVSFTIDEDIYSNSTVILRRGSKVYGTLTKCHGRAGFGIAGYIEVTIDPQIKMTDGRTLLIDVPKLKKRGKNKTALALTVGTLFFSWGGWWWFMPKHIRIPSGTPVYAHTVGTIE